MRSAKERQIRGETREIRATARGGVRRGRKEIAFVRTTRKPRKEETINGSYVTIFILRRPARRGKSADKSFVLLHVLGMARDATYILARTCS